MKRTSTKRSSTKHSSTKHSSTKHMYPVIEQKIFDENDVDQLNNKYVPQHPFRLLITGESACGKTNLLLNLLDNYLFFENLYVCAKDLEEIAYEKLQEYYSELKDIDIEDIKNKKQREELLKILDTESYFTNSIQEMVGVDDLDKDRRNLVIFDDCITEKDQKLIEDLFVRGRKKNSSLIYMSFYKVPKIIRENCNYYIFFKLHHRDLKRIIKEIDNTELPDVELTNHDFLMLDRKSKDPIMKFRVNFIPL